MKAKALPLDRVRQPVVFICKACNGTGASRHYEYRDCDVCDGRGSITSYVELRP